MRQDHFADVNKMVNLGYGSQRDHLKYQFGISSQRATHSSQAVMSGIN